MIYDYTGTDARYTARTGRVEITDLSEWVKARFQGGWKRLTVRDPTGQIVGEIATTINGHRWWSPADESVKAVQS
jgi:hypothetical protein